MQEKSQIPNLPNPPKKKTWLWIAIGIVIILAILVLLRGNEDAWIKDKFGNWQKHGNPSTSALLTSKVVNIPQKILDNKFGWLGGGAEDIGEGIIDGGGAWVRPHPGAFVWDMMQKSAGDEIDFSGADEAVSNLSKNDLGILATIWPFADWDQKNLANAADCKVSSNDEMLLKNDKKGRGSYLPEYRCNPSNWTAYQKFVTAVVERYDGDGISDMPGLKIPIKYWELMNEPDLQYGSNASVGDSDRLTFYKQGPAEYGELLKKSYTSIKSTDSTANVLIAGAAGADERMLGFYEKVFAVEGAKDSFDIGNIHCISNDRNTHDFNVDAYKKMLADFDITKPIWVTEAEAMYGTTGEANFQSTKTSTSGAIAAGAERIFFTRYTFDDFRTDMSQKTDDGTYPSTEKYKEITKGPEN